ncbi:hypothetical protein DFH28DRAFT_1104740 [Melampsora americana]|nr:hypothetical protein DFH28DRAFT_1104740 [Melampsora americana]
MDWSNPQFNHHQTHSFDRIQRFLEDHPVGTIGAKLLSSNHQIMNQSNPTPPHHQNNPSPPESIPSPSSSSLNTNSIQTKPNQTSSLHSKRKTSPDSISSSSSKDYKDHTSQKKVSLQSDLDHHQQHHQQHQLGSEPSDHHPEPKGVGKSKRKEQNRNAQRAFRERKERRLQELQDQVDELLAKQEPLTNENKHLKELVNQLQTENQSLGVYKEAFTFTVANDLRRSSMPISKAFDPPPSSTLDQSIIDTPLPNPSQASQTNLLKPTLRGNQENLNRLGLSLPSSRRPDQVHHQSNSNQTSVIQKPTPRNGLSNGNGTTNEGFTPPLSSSSSLASFLNTNQSPVDAFSEDHRAYVFNSSKKVSKPLGKIDPLFPTYTSSTIPPHPISAFDVHPPDPPLHSKQLNHTDLTLLPTFTSHDLTSSTLNFNEILPLNETRQASSELDSTFWNSYLNFETPKDQVNHPSEETQPIEGINSHEAQSPSILDFGFQTFHPQSKSFSDLSKESNLRFSSSRSSQFPLDENLNLFNQWRSPLPEPHQDLSSSHLSMRSESNHPIDSHSIDSTHPSSSSSHHHHHQLKNEEKKRSLKKERIGSLIKFVDEGVLSNQELDGLCEMLESKATCKEKSELMKDVVAIRPEWSELIEDITKKAKAKCTSGSGSDEVKMEENEKTTKVDEGSV